MGWKEILQIGLFVLAWIPIGFLAGVTVLGVPPTLYDSTDFSIYNDNWNGCSNYRVWIEQNGYDAQTIESTMSVINRFNGSAVLVIMGPVKDFSIDATLTIFQHLMAGGGVIIADDFGTANSSFLLLNDYLLSQTGYSDFLNALGVRGFVSFTKGVVMDLDSYYVSPRLPIIRDFNPSHPITAGVNELHLNNASALTPTCAIGATGIAWTSSRAWSENDTRSATPTPDPYEYAGRLPVIGALDIGGISPGIGGRLVAISDPSIFINEMWDQFAGNRRLSQNLIDWITNGDTDVPIVFCEQLLEIPIASGEFWFGNFMGRMLWASTNIILAPVYPLMTAIGIKKYLPDMKKPEMKSVSEVFMRRGQTYFSERMTYYRTEGNYARVVKMLYRKLRRSMQKKYQWTDYDKKKVWDLIQYKDSKIKEVSFFKTIGRIEEISSKPNTKIRESEMMKLFFWMKNLQDKLVEAK
ncbi:MAG: DUF4350 domain-containing protein [Candidatus Thorarchaeota archaeon]|jgi:hypothetical protein